MRQVKPHAASQPPPTPLKPAARAQPPPPTTPPPSTQTTTTKPTTLLPEPPLTTPTTKPAAKAKATDIGIDLSDTIPDEVPTVQSLDQLIAMIKASQFGQLLHIQELEPGEMLIAYIVFLMIVVGRKTTSNTQVHQEHDWWATRFQERKTFINGYYGAWKARHATWNKETAGSEFRNKEGNNGLIAFMGTITATAIRMTDEHVLRALAEGSDTTTKRVWNIIVGRKDYTIADTDMCKILIEDEEQRTLLGTFAPGPDGKGKLYHSVIEFLPNTELLSQLTTPDEVMDLTKYNIPIENTLKSTSAKTPQNKRKRVITRKKSATSASPSQVSTRKRVAKAATAIGTPQPVVPLTPVATKVVIDITSGTKEDDVIAPGARKRIFASTDEEDDDDDDDDDTTVEEEQVGSI